MMAVGADASETFAETDTVFVDTEALGDVDVAAETAAPTTPPQPLSRNMGSVARTDRIDDIGVAIALLVHALC